MLPAIPFHWDAAEELAAAFGYIPKKRVLARHGQPTVAQRRGLSCTICPAEEAPTDDARMSDDRATDDPGNTQARILRQSLDPVSPFVQAGNCIAGLRITPGTGDERGKSAMRI